MLRKSFLDFLDNGGGVVCLHFAIAANRHWPEFKELFGATFTGHPWTEEVGVTVEEPEHPLVAAFGGKDFRITDEIYQYGPPYDRSKLRVLMSIDPATTNMGPRWINRKTDRFCPDLGEAVRQGADLQHLVRPHGQPVLELRRCSSSTWTRSSSRPATWRPRPRRARAARSAKTVPGTQPAPGLEPGFVSLFDGKTLDGWDGDRTIWSVAGRRHHRPRPRPTRS